MVRYGVVPTKLKNRHLHLRWSYRERFLNIVRNGARGALRLCKKKPVVSGTSTLTGQSILGHHDITTIGKLYGF